MLAMVGPAGPGVHILAEQRDLPGAAVDQRLGFVENHPPASRDLGAARIGHDTVGAEFVAAFLHGEEGRGSLLATRGQRTELGFHGPVGVRSEEHTYELTSLLRI